MIVLLSYSTSWCRNDNYTISSTREQINVYDSVLISFDDLRKANAKMVELKYEKEINDSLRSIINNSEIIMREYECNIDALKKQIKQEVRKRKIASWGGFIISLSLGALIIFK